MKDISKHRRIDATLPGPLEHQALQWLEARAPTWMTPDLFTATGSIGTLVVLVGYGLSGIDPARRKRELRKHLIPMLRLLNETFLGIYGYSPLDDDELADLAKKFMPLIDVRFLKIVLKGDDVIGFMVGLPDLHDGIPKSEGHLFPFGLFHILRATKRARQLDLLLGGIREQHRGMGIDMLMGREMTKSAIAAGFECYDSHHEMETNTRVRAEMERWGGTVWKKYRIFQKPLHG